MNYENEKELVGHVVSSETGEIIDDIYSGDKVVHKKTDEQKDDHIIYNFNSDKPFVKLYLGVNELRKHLTPGEFTIAISLADFICYEDCILRKGGHLNGKILSIEDLSVEMDMNYEALRKQINSLVKKGVIGIHKTGCKDKPNTLVKAITVNPYIYTKGNNINETIASLFSCSRWK